MYRWLAILLIAFPALAWGQSSTNTLPPSMTVSDLGTLIPARQGARALVTDGATATDCTVGSGSTSVICEYDGSGWIPASSGTASILDQVILCGQMNENGTVYFGPATAQFGGNDATNAGISSTACDALDNTTEATVDAPILAGLTFAPVGMWCQLAGTLGASETVSFTFHNDTAVVSPSLACSLATGETQCSTAVAGPVLAANQPISIAAVMSSNNTDDDGWCRLTIQIQD